MVMQRIRTLRGSVQHFLAVARQWQIYHVFLDRRYQQHTIARLAHLDSLNLDLREKRVLEVGAGNGEHTLFYLHRRCDVTVTDGRPELVQFVHNRFGVPAYTVDVETQMPQLAALGTFDVLHCYGLLYHLGNPAAFLRQTAPLTRLLVLETCVLFGAEDRIEYITEDYTRLWQAVSGYACFPSRSWVFRELKESYPYVYCPRTQPHHEQFPTDWTTPPAHDGLIRAVFIASAEPLDNPMLVDDVPDQYASWP